MGLRIFNTLTGEKETFQPLQPQEIGFYCCGPTVYDMSHVGHARVYVAFDVVVRYLRWRGHRVKYVRNYTDVDDKIIRRAAELGETPSELSERFIREYLKDMASLGVGRGDVEPKVTEHIPEIVAIIEKLVGNGLAYASQGDVYFAVRLDPSYGKLSRRKLDDMRAGARVEPGEQKRDPLDFALWKAAKPGEPAWPSPWGEGRPGWHIECSAMSEKYLGTTFDLHAGGKDLVFPHHENEIAQSEGASGKPFAKVWMHNGFVTLDEEKMSKSLGNFFTIRDVIAKVEPEALRLFLLSTHYRSPINFSDKTLAEAEKRLDYFYETLGKVEQLIAGGPVSPEPAMTEAPVAAFTEAMDDDFNTPEALATLSGPFSKLNDLAEKPGKGAQRARSQSEAAALRKSMLEVGSVLGLYQRPPAEYLAERRSHLAARLGLDIAKVEDLIAQRNEARKAKDFARADAIRAELAALHVEIMDGASGTSWKIV
jgi:cysteinyl-tRNA synthetase